MAANLFDRLYYRVRLWLQKKNVVAEFDGIRIADLRETSPHFKNTILASLQLIKDYDPIRFTRARRHIQWIVNWQVEIGGGAEYCAPIRTCSIDFLEPDPTDAAEAWHHKWYAARHASAIVHEATHGSIRSRGIGYTPELRIRIEKLCVLEENRFVRRVAKLAHERSHRELGLIMECLETEFDAKAWDVAWNASKLERLRHIWKQR
jgi:hypothetical protein